MNLGVYNLGTTRLIPGAGYWTMHANVSVPTVGANEDLYIMLYKNGALEKYGTYFTATADSNLVLQVSHMAYVDPADYFEIYVQKSGAGSVAINVGSANTYMWAARLA
jgi:hypothetical protein